MTSNAVFSQVLLIECVAQLAGIIVAQTEGEGGFLASIGHADFSGTAEVGDILTVTAGVAKSFGRLFLIDGTVASAAGQLLTVQMTLGIGTL